jgi:outer membrane receptor protein involved in Fe transport
VGGEILGGPAHSEVLILNNDKTRARLLASSMICGVALLAGGQALAQGQGQGTQVGELVITGSRIPQPNLTSASPVTVVGNQEVKLTGTVRAEDLLNTLPSVFAGETSGVSNGATGIATVDLRGLGPARTLVLIDGKRLMPGDPTYPYADLNFVPSALIDHVEVLTGGASAVYGSDAVAGVVNFKMVRNFEGVRIDAQAGTYEHSNGDTFAQGLNKAKNFPYPTGTVWDGRSVNITAVIGVNAPDGKGNVTAYAGYRNIQPVIQSKRDYTACTLQETGSTFRCGGSGTTPLADIISNDLAVQGSSTYQFIVDKGGPGDTIRPFAASDVFNYGPYNYFQRPDEQYTAGAFAHYEVNEHLDVYTDLMFMDDHTRSQIAPSGVFGQTFNIPCSSPLLSAQEVNTLCTAAGLGPADSASLAILKRNTEGGPRIDDLRHTDYRVVLGAKGAINSDWNYDVYGQIGRDVYAEEFLNDLSLRRVTEALNVDRAPDGSLQCVNASARQEGCVPYDIFHVGGVTPAALHYVSVPGFKEGSTTELVMSGSISGTLNSVKSPYANDALGLALGAEYRREVLDLRVDPEFESGDLTGQGGPTTPVSGAYQVYELFGEARVPLVQDATWAKDLSLDVGYRYSDYSSSGVTNTYKVEGDWQPIDDIKFRASFEHAVRAPNVVELFTPQGVALLLDNDPCAGPTPDFTQQQCANTGVSASQYGHVPVSPAAQYNGLQGGNPNLKPEKADSYTIGAVLTPRMLPGLNVSVDYFNIKVNDYIQQLDANIVLQNCALSGDPTVCSMIHRAAPTANLWLGTSGYVNALYTNAGFLKTDGVDVEANYRMPLSMVHWDNGGTLAFRFNGTWLHSLITDPGLKHLTSSGAVDATNYDCSGLYGKRTCGTPSPHWRHNLRVTWTTPWAGIDVSAAWRYTGSVQAYGVSTSPYLHGTTNPADLKLAAQSYFDLSAQWRVRDSYTVRLGVNNIFDKDPPLVGNTWGGTDTRFNGNTYPGVYDALGRYMFVGVTADF